MAMCRSRLAFAMKGERRSPDSGIIQTLNFNDSDGEMDTWNTSMESANSSPTTPKMTCKLTRSSDCWDSGIGSPTPNSVRMTRSRCKSPRGGSSAMSPIPFNFTDSDEDQVPPLPTALFTPPHKKFGSLRLHDTPQTPKSLLQRSQRRIITRPRYSKGKPKEDRPEANINPFTPVNNSVISRLTNNNNQGLKRPRNSLDSGLDDSLEDEIEDDFPTNKRLALHEINTSRYNEEFHEVCKLGDGEFGSVYKCINRLDGCVYAIKKSKTPVAGSAYERTAMNEVYAHAVVGKHPHVVRYYSAWAENNHMYIQDEYCNGGSLAERVSRNHEQGMKLSELDLKQILLQISKGLLYIHSQNLVHLDIKPGNIFIHLNPKPASPESGLDEDMCEEFEPDSTELITYKIGDLGHVTSVTNPLVEEGDCRYLPREILQEEFKYLPRADIFSLALTILEAGGLGELPKNGDKWHLIRQGEIPRLPQISDEFHQLLKSMVHPDPQVRPSSVSLVQHPVLCPYNKKSKAQLRRELNEERFKNELLTKQLQQAKEGRFKFSSGGASRKTGDKASRLIGKKYKRSMSLNCF